MDRFEKMQLEECYRLINGAYLLAQKNAKSTDEDEAIAAILKTALNKLYDLEKEGASDD